MSRTRSSRRRTSHGGKTGLLDGLRRFEDGAAVAGLAMSADELRRRVRDYSWKESFIRLADLAAVVANADDGADSEVVRRKTVDPLMALTGSSVGLIARIKDFVAANRDTMVVAHEEALNYLQHLVLLEGADDGPAPSDSELSLWLIGINDHVSDWLEPDTGSLSSDEELIAACAHALRFNNSPDVMREVARTFRLLEALPLRGELASADVWREVQDAAFGCSFRRYFSCFAAPLTILAQGWGSSLSGRYPVFNASEFYSASQVEIAEGAPWLQALSIDRDAARAAIAKRLRSDGLPHAPTVLLQRPLVATENDRFVAASPWMIRIFIKSGLWARMLSTCKDKFNKGADIWLSAFGDQFEQWCRDVALDAAAQRWFQGELLLPSAPGASDEIEDVVIREGRAAVFFSAKGRFVPEPIARHAESRSALIEWYEKYFFGARAGGYRTGVVRLLDARIAMLREGKFEPSLARSTRVLPVILTYDSLCEDALLYQWLERRCAEHGYLQQDGVAPLTLAKIDDFEQLMFRASQGESVVGTLRKREAAWKDRRLDQLLCSLPARTGGHRPKRLPMIEELFAEVRREMSFGLFRRD